MAFKSNIKSSITHHADGNSMASPIQTAVGKVKPNLLITEGLLKILRELIPLIPPKSLTNFLHGMVSLQNAILIFVME